MRPRDQLRHAARQHRRCDKPACAVREEVPTTPCARCQRATHEQCRTEKQVRHRAEEGQSICRRCGDTDETAEECVALSCVTGAMRCLVCRRGVCPQHNVRQHIGDSAPCCMKCLVGMLAATADYTELQCAVAVQAVRARTSLSPVRSVGLMQRGREAGAEARRREQLKCDMHLPGVLTYAARTYVQPGLRTRRRTGERCPSSPPREGTTSPSPTASRTRGRHRRRQT